MIDPNTAGTLAQVLSVFLIMLALEKKLSVGRVPRRDVRRRLMACREIAIILDLVALALCLAMMIWKWQNLIASTVVSVAAFASIFLLFMMFAAMVERESKDEASAQSRVD